MAEIEKLNVHPSLLKELQAKQATFKLKRSGSLEGQLSSPMDSHNMYESSNTVRNIASRFENNTQNTSQDGDRTHIGFVGMSGNRDVINCSDQSNTGLNRRASASSIDPKQIEEEQCDQKAINNAYGDRSKSKKKSVSFCDQVILVSTAEDQEDDSYIPNPILERVLKSAMNKPELTTMPLQSEKPSLQRQDSFDSQSSRSTISSLSQNSFAANENTHAEYVRLQNNYPPYQMPPNRLQQQYNAQKNNSVYGTNSPVQTTQNQSAVNSNQIYQTLPANAQQNTTSPIPYNQPPAVYSNHSNASPPNFSQTPANRLTPTHNPAYMSKHPAGLPRSTPAMSQPINNAYYHRVPPTSCTTTMPSNNYPTNRQYTHNNMPNTNHSPYQSVPTNSPAYQSYHNPPTSYASSEYSSRYPQTNSTNHYTQSPYQRVPPPHGDVPVENYNTFPQKIPNNYYVDNQSGQPRVQDTRHYANTQHQRSMYSQNVNVDSNANTEQIGQYQYAQNGYNPYQIIPPPKQLQKKSVSFEPGTKGGTDSPIPPQMNGNLAYPPNDAQAPQKTVCNLCRKKSINPPAMYCPDCDFYMSRFKPRS